MAISQQVKEHNDTKMLLYTTHHQGGVF